MMMIFVSLLTSSFPLYVSEMLLTHHLKCCAPEKIISRSKCTRP